MSQPIKSFLRSSLGRTLLSLLITAGAGFVYFYITLPALNPHSGDFYSFLVLLCVVYLIAIFLLSGGRRSDVVMTPKERAREWFRFIRSRCLPVGLLLAAAVLVSVVGELLSLASAKAIQISGTSTPSISKQTTFIQMHPFLSQYCSVLV